jgi:hypothetical protein
MIVTDTAAAAVETQVRVGTHEPRLAGPAGGTTWESMAVRRRIGARDGHAERTETVTHYYQTVTRQIIEHALIRVADGTEVPCHRASMEELQLLDATFALVPPPHLRLVNTRKPGGFLIADTAGAGGSVSFMGGLNPSADYSDTPDYDERQLIIITRGALWENRDLGICPTAMHEIGHVMTHRGWLSYDPFPGERRRLLAGTRVSRNPGALEALCNAYMYFLCYAAEDGGIRDFGTRSDPQRDRVTRDALRECSAFSPRRLGDDWIPRFEERRR